MKERNLVFAAILLVSGMLAALPVSLAAQEPRPVQEQYRATREEQAHGPRGARHSGQMPQESQSGPSQGVPLSRYLRPDGTLDLPPEGIPGSLDPTGFNLASAPGEPPRFTSAPPEPNAADDNWDSRFYHPGMNGSVCALAWDGMNLYVGGGFTTVGKVAANCIAKWDGTTWSPLGIGMNNAVYALAWDGSNLYAGGDFTTAGGITAIRIAKWDGAAWNPLGTGVSGGEYYTAVCSLVWDGANIYAGGYFTVAGGAAANRIAKWDGAAWSPLGAGVSGGQYYTAVYSLCWDGTNLYAGGDFTIAGGSAASRIAKWDGFAWSPIGLGINSPASALASDGTNLYAGGSFSTAGGVAANRIAKWDGTTWRPLGTGMAGVYSWVNELVWNGTSLYAGGVFTSAGGVAANRIAKWDGTAWSALGAGVRGVDSSNGVSSLAWDGTNLYAGGSFSVAGSVVAVNLGQWDGNAWNMLATTGEGMDHYVFALAWDGTNLYAGGGFTIAGNIVANGIAKWDGTAWSPLGSGMNNAVSALAWDGANLYAGGSFTIAGDVAANYIAKWDGTSWSPLGSGVNTYVNSLAWDGADLYAGGDFSVAGGVVANHVAKWNGAIWSPLGSGTGFWGTVNALAWDGTYLYAGGGFYPANGGPGTNIAKWDGQAWSALGAGLDLDVLALAWDGTYLYAGGHFFMAGDVPVNRIAKWDGTVWSALGTGVDGVVHALASNGSDLYAGGDFMFYAGEGSPYVARWDGKSWGALGTGTNGAVNALAYDGSGLFVGGFFERAGDKSSSYIARWTICQAPSGMTNTIAADLNPCASGIQISWPQDPDNWNDAGPGSRGYMVLRDGLALPPGDCGGILPYGTTSCVDDSSQLEIMHSYRVSYVNSSRCQCTSRASSMVDSAIPVPWLHVTAAVETPISEPFEGSFPPQGWWMTNSDWGCVWQDTADLLRDNYTGGSGIAASADSDYCGSWGHMDTALLTPVFSLANGACQSAHLQFKSDFYTPNSSSEGYVAITSDGVNWIPLLYYNGPFYRGPRVEELDLTPFLGESNLRIQFAYSAPDRDGWWQIDDVIITTVNESSPCNSFITTGRSSSYQWMRDGQDIFGATAQDYRALVSGSYAVRVSDANGCIAISEPQNVVIYPSAIPVVTGESYGCQSPGVSLSTGLYTSYQWIRDGADIPGGTAQTYTATVSDMYSVRVSDANGCSGTSPGHAVSVAPSPEPTITGSACIPAVLTTESFASYQWYRNGSPIPGATGQNFDASAHGTYTVRVTDIVGCSGTSSEYIVRWLPAPTVTGADSSCGSVSLSTGTGYGSYQWNLNNTPISGATAQSYTATATGYYSVTVTESISGCSATSAEKSVVVHSIPVPVVTGSHFNTCPQTTVPLSAPAGFNSYQWAMNGLPIAGATASAITVGVTGAYSFSVTDSYGCAGNSDAFVVFVDFCAGSEVSPAGAFFPARLMKDGGSPTGYYLYFQRLDSLSGYNIYEGEAGVYYSHARATGNTCAAFVEDLFTGEMRAAITPSAGNRYYLVTAYAGGAEGPSGFNWLGTEIPASQSTCGP